MVEQNILENIKDWTDVTLAGTDAARYEVDQMTVLGTKAANYVFRKTIATLLVKRTQWVVLSCDSQWLSQRKFSGFETESDRAKIDLDLFFTLCPLGHKYHAQKPHTGRLMSPVQYTNIF